MKNKSNIVAVAVGIIMVACVAFYGYHRIFRKVASSAEIKPLLGEGESREYSVSPSRSPHGNGSASAAAGTDIVITASSSPSGISDTSTFGEVPTAFNKGGDIVAGASEPVPTGTTAEATGTEEDDIPYCP